MLLRFQQSTGHPPGRLICLVKAARMPGKSYRARVMISPASVQYVCMYVCLPASITLALKHAARMLSLIHRKCKRPLWRCLPSSVGMISRFAILRLNFTTHRLANKALKCRQHRTELAQPGNVNPVILHVSSQQAPKKKQRGLIINDSSSRRPGQHITSPQSPMSRRHFASLIRPWPASLPPASSHPYRSLPS
jgi:hypothetical protein